MYANVERMLESFPSSNRTKLVVNGWYTENKRIVERKCWKFKQFEAA